jgi:putative ABC transport system substrate-binding protein
MRRVGVLTALTPDDPEAQERIAAFVQGLEEVGWSVGRNLRILPRWVSGHPELYRKYAAELVELSPDVILANGEPAFGPLQQMTRTIPIVFVNMTDPVDAGWVASLSRPGGNATGFTSSEYSASGKWLQLLKEIAPTVTRVAVVLDPTLPSSIGQFAAIHAVAASLRVELSPIDTRDAGEVERAISAFAQEPNGGVILTGAGSGVRHSLVGELAARYRLPAVYPFRYQLADGGLISYGADIIDQYRRAAAYVDRILKGESPADLPVQAPTKYELVINLKTAKPLGLTVPTALLARADEVIE